MCAKLRAAAGARLDPNLVLIARTDARGVTGFDDAVERAKQYLDAGADWIFPEALATQDEFKRFAEAIDAPLIANMTEFGKSPLLTLEELGEMGYSVALYPVTLLRVAMRACEAALGVLGHDGTQRDILDLMQSREELYDLLNYVGFEERDRAHFGGAAPAEPLPDDEE
jgi:methylisocitrate lyase